MPLRSPTLAGGGAIDGANLLPSQRTPPAVKGTVAAPAVTEFCCCLAGMGHTNLAMEKQISKAPNHMAPVNAPPSPRAGHSARRPAKLANMLPPIRAFVPNPDAVATLAVAAAALAAAVMLCGFPIALPAPPAPGCAVILDPSRKTNVGRRLSFVTQVWSFGTGMSRQFGR